MRQKLAVQCARAVMMKRPGAPDGAVSVRLTGSPSARGGGPQVGEVGGLGVRIQVTHESWAGRRINGKWEGV